MNVFTFSGNLGSNAEQRTTGSGTNILQFSVAVSSGYGDRKKTNWVRCSLFGKRGESLAPYLIKGQQVVVSGEASLHEWEKDGVTNKSLEVNVSDVTLVGGKPQQSAQQQAPQTQQSTGGMGDFDDSIPF